MLCIYCGLRHADTVDHTPQKSLFLPGTPQRTVPACSVCNNGLSKDEEWFKVFAASMAMDNSQAANTVFETSVSRTLKHNKGLLQSLNAKMSLVEVRTASGIYTGEKMTKMKIEREDWARVERVVENVFRGVFYLETTLPLPSTHKVGVFATPAELLKDQSNVIHLLRYPGVPDKNVFWYGFRLVDGFDDDGVALLVFYDNLAFFAFVLTEEREQMKRDAEANSKSNEERPLIIRRGGPGWTKK